MLLPADVGNGCRWGGLPYLVDNVYRLLADTGVGVSCAQDYCFEETLKRVEDSVVPEGFGEENCGCLDCEQVNLNVVFFKALLQKNCADCQEFLFRHQLALVDDFEALL